jgi:V/A-type H+-transporting ATPase subunit B
LPDSDRRFLAFGDAFEAQMVNQSEARTLEQSMAVGWELLRALPRNELTRLSSRQIQQFIAEAGG